MGLGEVFILSDKVECCVVDDTAGMRNDLIPSMSRLAEKAAAVRGIFTSMYEAPEHEGIDQVYIDTARRPASIVAWHNFASEKRSTREMSGRMTAMTKTRIVPSHPAKMRI